MAVEDPSTRAEIGREKEELALRKMRREKVRSIFMLVPKLSV